MLTDVSLVASLVALAGLLVLVLTTVRWFRLALRVAIPDNRVGFLLLWSASGGLGLISLLLPGANWLSYSAGTLAMVGGFALLGLYALRKQGVGESITVGDQIPSFSAMDENNLVIESAVLSGSPVLIKFFRGHW